MIHRVVTLFSVSFFLNLLIFTVAIGGTVSYQYDALDRLVRMEQLDGTVMVYDYDDPGNRIVKTVTVVDSDGDGIPDGDEDREKGGAGPGCFHPITFIKQL
jgi:YD repeat-containing protein